jgi:hypothetical protein
MRVVSQGNIDTSGIKRCYLPGLVVESDCPACGRTCQREYTTNYLDYPENGQEMTVYFYCGDDCPGDPEFGETEWEETAVFRCSATLEPTPDTTGGGDG